jgi:hypothetical protein
MFKRVIDLKDQQYTQLKEAFDWANAVDDTLASLVSKMAEERAVNIRRAWDTVHRLAQIQKGELVSIDWVNQCLTVKDKPLEDGPITWEGKK